MIGAHIALLGRRGHSGGLPLWALIIKGVLLLFILYTLIVVRLMGSHFQSKALELSREWRVQLGRETLTDMRADCELGRLARAERLAWNDAGTFSMIRMIARWNQDYLAEQNPCSEIPAQTNQEQTD